MSNAPFPIDPVQTAVAIAYRNKRLIAEQVLPRVPVGKQEFKYLKHAMEEGFTIPDTKVGRKSKPTQVSFSATEQTDATEDYALDDPIPNADIDNAPENFDPLSHSTTSLTNLILLDREVRTAGLVFDANIYPTGNKKTLAGTDQWNDFANSDPLTELMTALDVPIMRPNIMTIGREAFTKLIMHPVIVKAMHGNSGDSGVANRQILADLLELDEVFVGEGYVNTARKGQTAAIQRVWGKHCALTYRDELASADRGTTFGFTAQFGDRISGSQPDGDIGMRGGLRNRVGESVKELITAADLGFFLQNVIA